MQSKSQALKEKILEYKGDKRSIVATKMPKHLQNELIKKHPKVSLKEALYCELHDIDSNLLRTRCGKMPTFRGVTFGYGKYCGQNCQCKREDHSKIIKHNWANTPKKEREDIIQRRKNTTKERYGVDNPSQSDIVKEKKRQTTLQNWGTEHVFQNEAIKHKTKQTNLERYGCTNPNKRPEVREKIKQTNLERYGAEYYTQTPEYRKQAEETNLARYGVRHQSQHKDIRQKQIRAYLDCVYDKLPERLIDVTPAFDKSEYLGADKTYPWRCNKCHTIFYDTPGAGKQCQPRCLKCYPYFVSQFEKDIASHITQHYSCLRNTRAIIGKELDIYIPELKIAIECNGIYWHSELNGKDKFYHLRKTELCDQHKIQLIHVWEDDWSDKQEIIKSRLNSLLGVNNPVYARKTTIVKLQSKETTEFLEQNHLQGACRASIHYGLMYNNHLVAVMTFGKARFSKRYEYELLRYCSVLNSNVVGGASKLFKHFINEHNPSSVISYANKEWSRGELYKKLGFEFSHDSAPSYYYIDRDRQKRQSRLKFQKHKLSKVLKMFDSNVSEWENMQRNGYDRIWDCGNSVWIWTTL